MGASYDSSTFLRNMAIAGAVACVAAVAFHAFATPALVSWFIGKGPVEEVAEADETRKEVTRQIASAMLASLIGPSPPPPDGGGAAPSNGSATDGGSDAGAGTRSDEATEAGETARRHRESDRAPAEAGDGDGSREAGAKHRGGSRESSGDDAKEREASRASSGEPTVPEEPLRFEVDRGRLNSHLRNTRELRRRVAVVANRRRGGDDGLRVIELSGYYAQFGIRPGDVILSINGERLQTRQGAIARVMRMRNQTRFRLRVRRDGETFEIVYHIPPVAQRGGTSAE